jgi:hypothetical protein
MNLQPLAALRADSLLARSRGGDIHHGLAIGALETRHGCFLKLVEQSGNPCAPGRALKIGLDCYLRRIV